MNKRFEYFIHAYLTQNIFSLPHPRMALYRFPRGNKTKGEVYGIDKRWRGGKIERQGSNWTRIAKKHAKAFKPKAVV
jgi:hypothetical protein